MFVSMDSQPRPATTDDPVDVVLAGLPECPTEVQRVIASIVAAAQQPIRGELGTGPIIEDGVVALGRARHVLEAELGRRLVAAETHDVLTHTPAALLQREAGWTTGASGLVQAARLTSRYPQLQGLWETGQVSREHLALVARAVQPLTEQQTGELIDILAPRLAALSCRALTAALQHALGLLRPDDTEAQEQRNWDRRSVTATSHAGMVMITADLPALEGETFLAALDALAAAQRAEGDGLSKAQRRADAVITMTNRCAAHGDLPASTSGLPVSATVTIGLTEAERIVRREDGAGSRGITPAGQTLGDAAQRFLLCAGQISGVVVDDSARPLSGLAAALSASHPEPLALGRSVRIATSAQRRALAARDHGCAICGLPPADCQVHHVRAWADGGSTDIDDLSLLCWTHHRAVDLDRWRLDYNAAYRPGGSDPYWTVTPSPRSQWKPRTADVVRRT